MNQTLIFGVEPSTGNNNPGITFQTPGKWTTLAPKSKAPPQVKNFLRRGVTPDRTTVDNKVQYLNSVKDENNPIDEINSIEIDAFQKHATGALIPTEEMLIDIPMAMPPVSSYSSNDLPKSFDLSSYMPPVRDQGQQGSCASWAVGYYLKGYHEHIDKDIDYGTGNDYDGVYSPTFLYNIVKIGDCNDGSYIYANLERVQNIRIATWKDMPYNDKDCSSKPSSTALNNSKCARILKYDRVRIHQPIEFVEMQDIKYYISHGNPIVIGILVYDGFDNPQKINGEYFYKD